jgi:hypothetical protein
LVASGSLPAATPALRVHLSHGRTIDVLDCRIEDSKATLTLPGGGTIAFPSSLLSRIEEVASEPAQPVEAAAETKEAPEALSAEAGPTDGGQAGRAATPVSGQVTKGEAIDALIRSAAQRHHLEPELLAAVIAVESGYRTGAVSPRGAQGLMQLMPGTAKDLDVTDPFDAKQNIDAGAQYLRQLLDHFLVPAFVLPFDPLMQVFRLPVDK